MLTRRAMFSAVFVTFAFQAISPAVALAAFDWDGTWSGTAANGRKTVIKISGGKVVSWTSNGSRAKIAKSTVSAGKVSIQHAEGARVTLTPRKDGSVTYRWQGNGASSTAILKR